MGIPDALHGRDGDDDQERDGACDEADLNQGVAVAGFGGHLGVLVGFGPCPELDLRVGEDRTRHHKNEHGHVDRDHEEIPLGLGDGAGGHHGGLGAAQAEDLGQLAA